MATLAEIRQYILATDLIAEVQQDDKEIEGSNTTTIAQGYSDLESISDNPEYSSFFVEADGTAATFIKKDEQDAESYLQGVTISAVDGTGTDQLYNNSLVWNSYYEEFEWANTPDNSPVTVWEVLSGQVTTLCTTEFELPGNGWSPSNGFWGSGALQQPTSLGNGDYWGSILEAQGSAAAWAPYESLSGGNDTALNQDMSA